MPRKHCNVFRKQSEKPKAKYCWDGLISGIFNKFSKLQLFFLLHITFIVAKAHETNPLSKFKGNGTVAI